jgi:hypothetical protein
VFFSYKERSILNDFIALDPSVICTGFEDDGQNPPVTGTFRAGAFEKQKK